LPPMWPCPFLSSMTLLDMLCVHVVDRLLPHAECSHVRFLILVLFRHQPHQLLHPWPAKLLQRTRQSYLSHISSSTYLPLILAHMTRVLLISLGATLLLLTLLGQHRHTQRLQSGNPSQAQHPLLFPVFGSFVSSWASLLLRTKSGKQ
jgi:hypothetical protein